MKTINVLSIGNSFSQDAHRYIHDLGRKEGVSIETVNLYIGGCPLELHFRNMQRDKRAYTLEVNGRSGTGFYVSIKEALLARSWDYVTVQQASPYSYKEDSYEPYLTELVKFIRLMCPKAKLLIHQTWGYESGSNGVIKNGFNTYDEMFAEVKRCYDKAAKVVRADGIIPSGTAFAYALQNGITKVHRDTFHASFGIGRLILAMVWYSYLTGNSVDQISFDDLDEEVSAEEYELVREAVKLALKQNCRVICVAGKNDFE